MAASELCIVHGQQSLESYTTLLNHSAAIYHLTQIFRLYKPHAVRSQKSETSILGEQLM